MDLLFRCSFISPIPLISILSQVKLIALPMLAINNQDIWVYFVPYADGVGLVKSIGVRARRGNQSIGVCCM